MSFTADHENEKSTRIYVYFCGEKNVSKAGMKTCVLSHSFPVILGIHGDVQVHRVDGSDGRSERNDHPRREDVECRGKSQSGV
jgi:hypothetical protein